MNTTDNAGFLRLSRKLFEHPLWSEPREYSKAEAWIDLVQMARYNKGKVWAGVRYVEVRKGEVLTSRRFLETRWRWSGSKVANFLTFLETEKMIVQKKTTERTTITLCNFDKYNVSETTEKATKKPQKNRKKTTKEPKKKKDKKDNNTIPPISPLGGDVDAVGDWRSDYQVYLTQLRQAYKQAKADPQWIAQRETYHPNLDVLLSLKKACTDFWATEEGWTNKTSKKTTSINWRQTFNNALTQPQNRVYKPHKNTPPDEPQVF